MKKEQRIKIDGASADFTKKKSELGKKTALEILSDARSFVLITTTQDGDVKAATIVQDFTDIPKLGITCNEIEDKLKDELLSRIKEFVLGEE